MEKQKESDREVLIKQLDVAIGIIENCSAAKILDARVLLVDAILDARNAIRPPKSPNMKQEAVSPEEGDDPPEQESLVPA